MVSEAVFEEQMQIIEITMEKQFSKKALEIWYEEVKNYKEKYFVEGMDYVRKECPRFTLFNLRKGMENFHNSAERYAWEDKEKQKK